MHNKPSYGSQSRCNSALLTRVCCCLCHLRAGSCIPVACPRLRASPGCAGFAGGLALLSLLDRRKRSLTFMVLQQNQMKRNDFDCSLGQAEDRRKAGDVLHRCNTIPRHLLPRGVAIHVTGCKCPKPPLFSGFPLTFQSSYMAAPPQPQVQRHHNPAVLLCRWSPSLEPF